MNDRLSLYKVLTSDLESPYQGMAYEVGETYHCEDFDDDPEKDCSDGLYAVGPDGLTYAWGKAGGRDGAAVIPVEVWGDRVEINEFKRRYEHMEIVGQPLSEPEVRELAQKSDVDYRMEEALYPVHPFEDVEPPEEITEYHLDLMRSWASVRASVGDSVRYSVGDSVRASVRDSVGDSVGASVGDSVRARVRNSVRASVRDSVWNSVRASVRDSVRYSVWNSVRASVRDSVTAYYGSLFPEIDKWKYIDHEPGEYPLQPAVDLWYEGLVPARYGDVWRLHGGEGAKILWEGEL